MKGKYSIGYKDSYGDFRKVTCVGGTKVFNTIEECKKFIDDSKNRKMNIYANDVDKVKIMQGWKVIEEISI